MDLFTELVIAQTFTAISYAMVLFLIASGLTLIYGMMHILNVAHISFFALGAYLGYELVERVNFWFALLFAPMIVALLGMVVERYILKRLHNLSFIYDLILTAGMAFFIFGFYIWVWPSETYAILEPKLFTGLTQIGEFAYPTYRYFIIIFGAAILIFMRQILLKTRIGMIVRAAVEKPDMVRALGINVPLLFTCIFGFGIWLAALAGVVISPITQVHPLLETSLGLDAFVVVIVGGFGSLPGSFVAALLFGFLDTFAVQFFPEVAPLIFFIAMTLILMIKPHGLFGKK